jgi:hypothetical protein
MAGSRDMYWVVGMTDAVAPKPNRPACYNRAIGTADILNKGMTLEMAHARMPKD